MIIKKNQYKCSKCNYYNSFISTELYSTKCPYCKIDMKYIRSFEYDDSVDLIKPSEPTVDHYKLKAQLEGRPAIKCPTCGSYHTNKLTSVERAVSFGIFGFASSKIGKSFECKNCGYKW